MDSAVILSARRTAIGKFQGGLASLPAPELGATAIRAALAESHIAPEQVDGVILGTVLPAGVGQAPARQAALKGGLPESTDALTVNKVCGSGLQAVTLAAQAIRCGEAQVMVAGGMESMSRAPWLIERQLTGVGDHSLVDSMIHDGLYCAMSRQGMGNIAERLAENEKISRADQDEFSLTSHLRAALAQKEGLFGQEIAEVEVPSKGGPTKFVADEGPRADTSIEKLAKLRPAFSATGSVTAGNSSMISDGAAAVVVASREIAKSRGVVPLAEIVASASAAMAPEDLFVAPIEAVNKLLRKTGHVVSDIDLWEINEAFAVQVLACQRSLGIDRDRLNVHGGAIALGHPIGASGARVLTTLVHALRRRNGELGVATLCLGGGGAVAMLVRRNS
jgi:acetyl-CoA C-acetyltransferase